MSTYRDHVTACPRCQQALTHEGLGAICRGCRGLWLDEARLDEMVREMKDGLGALAFEPRKAKASLPCPACAEPQDNVLLYGVAVERCPKGHGVWFDQYELQTALRAASMAADATPAPTDVPDVRIGFWRAVFSNLGALLGIAGYAVLGVATFGTIATRPDGRRR